MCIVCEIRTCNLHIRLKDTDKKSPFLNTCKAVSHSKECTHSVLDTWQNMGNVCLFQGAPEIFDFEATPTGVMQRTMRSVVTIQAVWRGYVVRRNLRTEKVHTVEATLPAYTCEDALLPHVVQRPATVLSTGVYIGEWNPFTNHREGRGQMRFADGSQYHGTWFKDKAHGRGRKIYTNGNVYEGEWFNDLPHGQGSQQLFSGGRSEGIWLQGLLHGQGKETWPDGSMYEGCYQRGLKHGDGFFQWPDGSSFRGQFESNNIEGSGTYTWGNKCTYAGRWKNNQMHGKGKFLWPDGRLFIGNYSHDKRHGKGLLTLPNGSKVKGIWVNGKLQGEAQETGPTGIVQTKTYSEGRECDSQATNSSGQDM